MAQILSYRFSSNGGDAADADAQTATVQPDGDVVVGSAVYFQDDVAALGVMLDEIDDFDDDGVTVTEYAVGDLSVDIVRAEDGTLTGFVLAGQAVASPWTRAKVADFASPFVP